MELKSPSKRGQSNALQVLAMAAADKSVRRSSNGASSRGGVQTSREGGVGVLAVFIAALGVLSVAWAVHAQWSRDSGVAAADMPGSAAPRESRAWPEDPALSPFAAAPASLAAEERAATALAAQPGQRASAVIAQTAASEEATLLEALTAPEEDLRAHGLEQALGAGVEVPLDTLQDLLANDSSDAVRELALQGLTERPEATREEIRSILEAAVANPSAVVRASAQRMGEQMYALESMDERARAFRRRTRAGGSESH